MRLLAAAACLAAATLLAQPAAAQFGKPGTSQAQSSAEMRDKQRQRDREAIDRQYHDSVKQRGLVGSTDLVNDPWANIRSAAPARSAR